MQGLTAAVRTKTSRIRGIGLGVGLIYPARSCMPLLMLCYYVLTSLIVGSTEFLDQLAKLNGEGANHLTCLDPPDPKSKRGRPRYRIAQGILETT
jgi:hypothetical protein